MRGPGGCAGQHGRPVRWRQPARSERLSGLTLDDPASLTPLGLAKAFHFRGPAGRAAMPNRLPGARQPAPAVDARAVLRRVRANFLDAALQAVGPDHGAGIDR